MNPSAIPETALEEIWRTAEEIGTTQKQSQVNGLELENEDGNYMEVTKDVSLAKKGKNLKARECRINKFRNIRAHQENELQENAEMEVKDRIKTAMRVAREVTGESQRRLKEGFQHMKEVSEIGRKELAKSKENRQHAVQHLKNNINKSRGALAKNSEKIREEKKLLEKLQKEEFDKILSDGQNPYEVYRKREIQKGHEKDIAKIKENIEQQEADLAVRIFKEEEVEFQNKTKEEQHRAAVQRFQRDMGILSKQEKVQEYLLSHTMSKTSVLNPTGGNEEVFSSEFSTAKTRAFGTGKAKSGKFLVEKFSEKYPDARSIPELLPRGKEVQGDASSKRTTKGSPDLENDDLVYAVPEFQATWKEKGKKSTSKDENSLRKVNLTVFEQDSLRRAKEKHKASMTQPQVVSGRKFEGNTFSTSPMVVFFKDFEVGKTHTTKVTLTNVSLGRATFKVLEIPLEFRTLFDIEYKLPGFVSPGMTSDVMVKFTPQVEKDLDTCIPLMSDSGPISIPVVCRTKKAVLELSSETIDFGAVTLGEGFQKSLTLKNHGCLDVALDVRFSNEKHGDVAIGFSNEQLNEESGLSVLKHEAGFTVGPVAKFLKGFESVKISLHYQAVREGDFSTDLILESRAVNSPSYEVPSECIHLFATGNPLPVSIERKTLDFGCCVFGEHYRDELVVRNSGKVAMKLRLMKRQAASEFFDFSPDMGFCQPGEDCIFHIDFRPQETILQNLSKFQIGDENGSMEIPMKVQVTNQALPLEFVLKFSVTTGDLVFEPPAIDFGDCILNEQAAATLTIRNNSALPHQFGFPSLPKGVRMNNRFGTILPFNSFTIEVFYQPSTPHKRSFSLKCQTLMDRTFAVPCIARGLATDLVFSHNHIQMPSTAVGDVSTSTTVLRNVGVAAKKWQLVVSQDSNLALSPAAGVLAADESVGIQVDHAPVSVHEQCPEPNVDATPEQSNDDQQDQQEGELEPKLEQDGNARSSGVAADVFPDVQTWKIPCMYSNEGEEIQKMQAIQLQISTCTVDEELKLEGGDVSTLSKSNYTTDFGSVSVGDHATHTVIVKNVGDCSAELKMEPLDPHGSFRIVNALRTIEAGQCLKLSLQFWPTASEPCQEILVLGTERSRLRLKLQGQGFSPEIKVTPEEILEGGLDMGHLSPLCQSERCIQLFNPREFPVRFSVGPKASKKTAEDGSRLVFTCRPSEGTLEPDESREVKVIFSPLSQGPAYVDDIEVKPAGQEFGTSIPVKGYCWSSGAFIVGADDPRQGKIDQEITSDGLHYKLHLKETVRCGETAAGVIRVGSLKNEKEKTGSPAELVFSSPDPQLLSQGWTVDTLKIQASAGDLKPVTFKFTAPDAAFNNTISRLHYPQLVSFDLVGMLKGGTPTLPFAEGVRIKITVSVMFDPRPTEKEETV
ncbi:hypothetical protein BSKO_09303 [Bryopsis sp. KO-2023]|nr:hypothetical protein BSKO_09303 [Bryopsis sp. KO-2023]